MHPRGRKGDIVLFGCSVEFRGESFHVTHSMASERCLSPRGHRRVATDCASHNIRQRGCQARSWLPGDPPPVLSRPEGPYRKGEKARTARQDSPLLLACVYAQAGRMDGFPVVKESRPLIPPRCLTPYSCWTTQRSHMMPKGHRGSSCFLKPGVLGERETSLEEPYARKSDHVCKKRDRPA